jgi:hypothetical protein
MLLAKLRISSSPFVIVYTHETGVGVFTIVWSPFSYPAWAWGVQLFSGRMKHCGSLAVFPRFKGRKNLSLCSSFFYYLVVAVALIINRSWAMRLTETIFSCRFLGFLSQGSLKISFLLERLEIRHGFVQLCLWVNINQIKVKRHLVRPTSNSSRMSY